MNEFESRVENQVDAEQEITVQTNSFDMENVWNEIDIQFLEKNSQKNSCNEKIIKADYETRSNLIERWVQFPAACCEELIRS